MRIGLRARLLAGYLALVVVVGGASVIVIDRSIGDALVGELDRRLVGQAREVARWLESRGHPDRLAPRLARVVAARITIVAADGTVAGDSARPEDVGRPVGDAPEIATAHAGAIGRAERALVRGGPPMYMVAVRTAAGGAVRVAVPLASIEARRRILRNRLLIVSGIALVVAALLGLGVIRAITRPLRAMTRTAERLARGDYEVPPPADAQGGDELALLSRTLALLAGEIKARVGELTAERDLSGAVVDALVEGVIAVDRAGAVVLSNRAATVLLGDAAAPLPAPLAALIDAARTGAERDDEIEVAGRAVRVAARPLPGGGAVAVLYDVTQLRALDRVRREFLASAAHELRTPVTAISGYAETLLGGVADEAARREFLEAIDRNAARITRLVADLLELERLEARPERLAARDPVPLAPIVAQAAASTRAAAAARGGAAPRIELAIGDDAVALGDAAGFEHVVQNLVDNAVVHGGGAVRVAARRDGKRVILTVADEGPGIAPEHQARIFERFYRVDPGRSRARGGSGLGLAIVAQHVAAAGGTIEVTSAPGAGTTFTVTLDAG